MEQSPTTPSIQLDHRSVLKTDRKCQNTVYDRIDLPQAGEIANASLICSLLALRRRNPVNCSRSAL